MGLIIGLADRLKKLPQEIERMDVLYFYYFLQYLKHGKK